jgi:RNA polymerase sigma factor (sigma-70 family)
LTEASLAALRRLLLLRYDDIKTRLTQRFGSEEVAGDALQDTWLRLERGEGIAAVRSLDSYLFRIAFNLARDRQRADRRRLTTTEVETLLNIADEAPDPVRTVEARSEFQMLKEIMADLPPRQRVILLAARLEGWSRREIADHCGISLRLVQRELQEAQDYCAARLRRSNVKKCSSSPRETSLEQEPPVAARRKPARPGDEK